MSSGLMSGGLLIKRIPIFLSFTYTRPNTKDFTWIIFVKKWYRIYHFTDRETEADEIK